MRKFKTYMSSLVAHTAFLYVNSCVTLESYTCQKVFVSLFYTLVKSTPTQTHGKHEINIGGINESMRYLYND